MYLFQVGSKVIALSWGTRRTLLHDHNSSNKRGVDVPTQQLVIAVELTSHSCVGLAQPICLLQYTVWLYKLYYVWEYGGIYYFNCSIAQLHNTFKLYEIQLPVTEGHCHLLLLDVLARTKTAGLSSGEITQMKSSLKLRYTSNYFES